MKLPKFLLKSLAIAMISFAGLGLIAPTPVAAQNEVRVTICTFIGPICQAFGVQGDDVSNLEGGAGQFIRARAQLLLSLVFIGIVLLAVVIIIQNGIKYIQSQGDETKIKDATKAIKSVFVGIGILFVGIAGIVLVLAFFGGLGLLSTDNSGGTGGCVINENGVLVCPTQN